jgi:hypothetical protein
MQTGLQLSGNGSAPGTAAFSNESPAYVRSRNRAAERPGPTLLPASLSRASFTKPSPNLHDVPNHALVIHEFFLAIAIPSCLFTLTLGIIAIGTSLRFLPAFPWNWREFGERFLRTCSRSCGAIGRLKSGSAKHDPTRKVPPYHPHRGLCRAIFARWGVNRDRSRPTRVVAGVEHHL